MFALLPRRKMKGFFPPMYGPLAPRMELPFFLGKVRDEFDRLFENFGFMPPPVTNGWNWGLDVEDKDEAIIVRAEAPGFEPTDFDVKVEEGYLVLEAHHKKEIVEKGKPEIKTERVCYETVLLPPGILPENITALYKNGVLTVTLPRKPEAKGVKVPVLPG
jgi:HSP20 family protein